MSRFCFCNCPAGFSADPERHAPDCPGRSGAGKARTPVPATTPALTVNAAEELEAVLHWRGKHTQAIRERDALQLSLTTADEKNDTLAMAYLRSNDREHELRKEIVLLRAALKFYADSDHYSTDDGLNWDSCSGEPANILWHESEPWFVEDGSIARAALAQSVEAADQEEAQQCQPQGEPVAVVLPKRRAVSPSSREQAMCANTWNACLDEVTRLNTKSR